MRYKVWNIALALLFIAGLAVFFYPFGANYLSEHRAQNAISNFDEAARKFQQMEKESVYSDEKSEIVGLYTDMQAYNLSLHENGQASLQDPFSYEIPAFDLTEYGFIENMVGYISIPKMEVELPIYLGAAAPNLALGAGNLGYTSLPIGGANTNTVLAAHRGYRGVAMFRDIETLEIGDGVYITNFWETLVYEVTETNVITPVDIQKVYIQEGRDMVTLITCHPYTKNYQRYVVFCERVESADTAPLSDQEKILHWNELSESGKLIFIERWFPIGVAVLLLMSILIRMSSGGFRRQKRRLSGMKK